MTRDSEPQRRSRGDILRERDERRREELAMASSPSAPPVAPPSRRGRILAALIASIAISFLVAGLLVGRERCGGDRARTRLSDPGEAGVRAAARRAQGIAQFIRLPARGSRARAESLATHARDLSSAGAAAESVRALMAQVTNRVVVPTRADLPRSFVVPPTNEWWAPFECGERPADGNWVRAEAAFAAAAAMEAGLLWSGGPNTNLSQQQILSAVTGHTDAYTFPATYGLVSESRLPYRPNQASAVDGRTLPPDVRARKVGMAGEVGVYDEPNLKSVLMACGPMVTYMNIYKDYDAFIWSEEWTYRPVPQGGETPWPIPVILMGWDDDEDCWIIVDPWIGECDWDFGWRGADKGRNALGIGTWNVLYTDIATSDR